MNRKTHRRLAADPVLEAQMRSRMKFPAMYLNGAMRKIVREAIEEHCQFRGWNLSAVNVRTNHVHVVVGAAAEPQKMIGSLKARATRLLRDAQVVDAARPVWTSEGGDVRRLRSREEVTAACRYVADGQGADLPEA